MLSQSMQDCNNIIPCSSRKGIYPTKSCTTLIWSDMRLAMIFTFILLYLLCTSHPVTMASEISHFLITGNFRSMLNRMEMFQTYNIVQIVELCNE